MLAESMDGQDAMSIRSTVYRLHLNCFATLLLRSVWLPSQMSHLLAVFAALLSSGISMLAFCWAWMSYSWFASAYDADDLTFRLATMVHMVGVIVFCGGPTAAFSIHC